MEEKKKSQLYFTEIPVYLFKNINNKIKFLAFWRLKFKL